MVLNNPQGLICHKTQRYQTNQMSRSQVAFEGFTIYSWLQNKNTFDGLQYLRIFSFRRFFYVDFGWQNESFNIQQEYGKNIFNVFFNRDSKIFSYSFGHVIKNSWSNNGVFFYADQALLNPTWSVAERFSVRQRTYLSRAMKRAHTHPNSTHLINHFHVFFKFFFL